MVAVQRSNITKWPSLGYGFHEEYYSLFYLQPIHNADFIVPVEIDGTIHQVLSNEMEYSIILIVFLICTAPKFSTLSLVLSRDL